MCQTSFEFKIKNPEKTFQRSKELYFTYVNKVPAILNKSDPFQSKCMLCSSKCQHTKCFKDIKPNSERTEKMISHSSWKKYFKVDELNNVFQRYICSASDNVKYILSDKHQLADAIRKLPDISFEFVLSPPDECRYCSENLCSIEKIELYTLRQSIIYGRIAPYTRVKVQGKKCSCGNVSFATGKTEGLFCYSLYVITFLFNIVLLVHFILLLILCMIWLVI